MKHTVKQVTLKNGVKGLMINIPDATVMTYDLNFRAGDYLTDPSKWETPHLMEHILLGANEKFPVSRNFQAELEKNGAYSNASTGSYDITYEAECADFEWDRILGLIVTAITKPLFLQKEFDSEFGNVREELYSRSNNHFRHLNLALREKFGFVARTDQERLDLLDNVTLKDVRAHYKKTHRAPNMRFVVAGNITKSRQEVIEKILGEIDLPKEGYRSALPDETPKSIETPLYIDNQSVKNIYFYIDTFTRRHISDNESYALSLANVLLTETLHSRIFGQAREQGLVYGAGSNFNRLMGSTNFWIAAQVSDKNIDKLFEIIVKEVNLMKHGKISDDELKAAKLYSLGRYQRGAQTVSSVASRYSSRYFYEEDFEDYSLIPEKIQSVTKEQMIAIINSMFSDKVRGFGVLGSCGNQIVEQSFGNLKPLWEQ